jgi:hypothetical protein
MFIKLLEGDIQTRGELITKNVHGKLLCLCFIHEEDVMVNTTGNHSVNDG